MNEKNEQKQENEQDSMIDLEVTGEQADQTRAGAGAVSDPDYKYVPVRRP
jgi:hypothetical protein